MVEIDAETLSELKRLLSKINEALRKAEAEFARERRTWPDPISAPWSGELALAEKRRPWRYGGAFPEWGYSTELPPHCSWCGSTETHGCTGSSTEITCVSPGETICLTQTRSRSRS